MPDRARRTAAVATFIALPAAAALSFQPLFALAEFAGWPPALAWLLPIALDTYAGGSILFGHQLTAGHSASGAARRNAVGALGLSVVCNELHHALVAHLVPRQIEWAIVLFVAALPPIVVERLLHLRMLAGTGNPATGGTETATGAATGGGSERQRHPAAARQPTAPPPASGNAQGGSGTGQSSADTGNADTGTDLANGDAEVINLGSSGGHNLERWAQIAAPLWRAHVDRNGVAPTAQQLADALERAGHKRPGERRARDIASATRDLVNAGGGTPEQPDEASDRAEAGAR